MKHLLRKVFFVDEPAQGAFFGWTLLFTMPWFWLVWIFRNNDTIRNLWIFDFPSTFLLNSLDACSAFVALVLLIYAVFLCTRISPQAWRNPNYRGKRCLTAVGAFLLAACVAFVFWVIIKTLISEAAYTYREHFYRDTDISDKLGIHGNGWGWFALAGVAMLVAAYFLIGKIISWSANVPYRKLIGKSVLALWSLLIASYVFCAAMALHATAKYHAAVEELSRYFGRPLTATALAEVYCNGRKPDAAFWSTIKALTPNYYAEQLAGLDHFYSSIYTEPDAILPENVYSEWKTWFLGNENFKALAKMLEQPLPPAERPYHDDELLSNMRLPELLLCRGLARWELWHQRFALEDGDVQAFKQSLQRMENISAYQQNDSLMIGSLVWIALERMRFASISKVISHQEVETDWLLEQSKNLSDLENIVPRIHRMSIYSEAALAVNTLELVPYMDKDDCDRPGVKLSELRWILPPAWWNLARNAEGLVRAYMISDWSDFPGQETDNLFISLLSGALRTAALRFSALIAESRLLRGLIEAELIKRKEGSYPEQMENLLIDPFSGQPLRYKKGPCVVSVPVFKKTENFYSSEIEYGMDMEERTIEAVQVWSVGPDGVDDGGIREIPEYGSKEKEKDDLRLIIRLE